MLSDKVYDRQTHLDEAVLRFEPQDLNETLSLALVLSNELEGYLADLEHEAQTKNAKEGTILLRALEAIIRGLMHAGADSPLLRSHSAKFAEQR